VRDDDGHRFPRGVRMAVCDKTFRLLRRSPYAEAFAFFEPRDPVPEAEAPPFRCAAAATRHPRETKGLKYKTTAPGTSCRDGDCC